MFVDLEIRDRCDSCCGTPSINRLQLAGSCACRTTVGYWDHVLCRFGSGIERLDRSSIGLTSPSQGPESGPERALKLKWYSKGSGNDGGRHGMRKYRPGSTSVPDG